MSITVLLVDDHPVVRSGLRAVLSAHPSLTIVGEAATGEEALSLAQHLTPAVVLCDLRLGDGIDGIETTKQLRALDDAPIVLMLTTFDRDAEVIGAIEAGAAGYLLKDAEPESIAEAIERAARGEIVLSPEHATRVLHGVRNPPPKLTEREIDVLALLATGATNREIAKALFVTEATVKSHLSHLFTKLQVDTRSKAVHEARARGFID
ncbi:response regulator [Leucobacter chinensis]|uniref:response regulator n=1 Tax=Leucobacter chinensis TaxID=2851010 RepID=UPI001C238B18|nr:response regulator transcription factor [Leucobacter chinensis]